MVVSKIPVDLVMYTFTTMGAHLALHSPHFGHHPASLNRSYCRR